MADTHAYEVRVMKTGDIAPVQRLVHDTIDACYVDVYPTRAVAFFKEFHSEAAIRRRLDDGHAIVAEHGADLVGTGAVVRSEILGVFVRQDLQHRGLGQALMSALESHALSQGIGVIELSVSLPSRAFYERLGYDDFELRSIDVGQGDSLRFWQATKRLVPSASTG